MDGTMFMIETLAGSAGHGPATAIAQTPNALVVTTDIGPHTRRRDVGTLDGSPAWLANAARTPVERSSWMWLSNPR
jgi:hypothetical protein